MPFESHRFRFILFALQTLHTEQSHWYKIDGEGEGVKRELTNWIEYAHFFLKLLGKIWAELTRIDKVNIVFKLTFFSKVLITLIKKRGILFSI